MCIHSYIVSLTVICTCVTLGSFPNRDCLSSHSSMRLRHKLHMGIPRSLALGFNLLST